MPIVEHFAHEIAYGAVFAITLSVLYCANDQAKELNVKQLLSRMIREDDGVLSFEWVLMITLLTIGVVSGLAAARDAIVDEVGDAAQAMVALDQSFYVDHPLAPYIIDARLDMGPIDGASDSGFTDFAFAEDCTRGNNAPNGQAALLDGN